MPSRKYFIRFDWVLQYVSLYFSGCPGCSDVKGKHGWLDINLLDCLQSAFSLKIRVVLISSSAIANRDVVITIRDLDEALYALISRGLRLNSPFACLGFAYSNFARKNARLLAVDQSPASAYNLISIKTANESKEFEI